MMRAVRTAALLVLAGCASSPVTPATVESTARPDARATRPSFDANAPPRIEAPTYALQLAAPSNASAGEPAQIAITIEGRGGFHVNLEYPVRIELGGSEGTVLSKATLVAADASELKEEVARFVTEASWSGEGRAWLAARVQFAVCTPDTCVPRQESLAAIVDVR